MAETEAVPALNQEEEERASSPAEAVEAPEDPAHAAAEPAEGDEAPPVAAGDHKRKLEELEPCEEDEEAPAKKLAASVEPAPEAPEASPPPADDAQPPHFEIAAADDDRQKMAPSEADEEKVPGELLHPDGETNGLAADGGCEAQKSEIPSVGNGQHLSIEDVEHAPVDDTQKPAAVVYQKDGLLTSEQQHPVGLEQPSHRIEVPNNKVGVLIGKGGDTIKSLQFHSGARIQITRDADADPNSTTRSVELFGSLESIDKAEKLIKDVIAEADAGGSPALVARGFGTLQSGGEQLEIRVPNEKVGLIIGKGGETIKSLQTRSCARIQLIPQHLPAGDTSKERIVRVSGNKSQIEAAIEMIKEVMNQVPGRPSPLSGGYSNQTFRPRAPTAHPQWGPRATAPVQQSMGYDHQQRGMYPPQASQYPPQPYGGSYPQQHTPRSSFSSTGWDQRPVQAPPQTGGYDYYGQVGQGTDAQPSVPAPASYNYGQSQASGYGHPTYPQSAPTQQTYGQGYNEPRYDSPAPSQQMYGQQPVSSQPGVYAQQPSGPQAGYTQQQPYGKPAYGGIPPQEAPQSYGPPRSTQVGDQMYQGPVQSSYGSGAPPQQSYPYGSGAPQAGSAYAQTYGPTSGNMDGYNQPPPSGYAQQGGQATPGYGQGGQPAPTYTQPGSQSSGYGQYASSQAAYGDQPVQSNVNYGYQGGPADAGYGNNVPSAGYGAPPAVSNQPGFQQPAPNPSGYYDQSVPPQSGYGSIPGNAPVGYTKSLSPQPGYGGQYDSVQAYGHH